VGGQKLRVSAVNPVGGLPEVKVNTPVHVAVPMMGIAMAGTDSATNTPHVKTGNNNLFRIFVMFRILRFNLTESLKNYLGQQIQDTTKHPKMSIRKLENSHCFQEEYLRVPGESSILFSTMFVVV